MNQLPLALSGLGPPDFEQFWAGANTVALARLRALALQPGADQVLLGGAEGSGKTHLLLATCEAAREAGFSVAYLPLSRLEAQALTEPVDADLVAVDDVDRALADPVLAQWLFTQVNRQHDRCRALLLAGRGAAADAVLPDLASRLARAEAVHLELPDDASRKAILMHRAQCAGIPLEPAAAEYLLRHHARDLRSLLARLSELDREALARGRRITVPLLREVM
ncbi:MAG TPA: DnaA regulatory inactivator Hda [Xanthomonadales bacterium]|nr:DnaA regulatory inactivator Hda [Xanthomonadales bacterium]